MNKSIFTLSLLVGLSLSTNVFADSAKLVNPANNHVYQRFDTKLTWTKAKASCESQNGYLATITSQDENNWILSKKLQGNSYTWLGATDSKSEGQWEWVTGEIWNYSNWNTGEPNNANNEDYLHIIIPKTGTWNDIPDNPKSVWTDWPSGMSYLCEWDKPLKNYTNMITTDTNNDGISEFVLTGNNGSVNKVVSIDRQNKTVISEVDFLAYPDYNSVSLSVVDDMNNNGRSEFSLLLNKKSDGSSIVETRDSGTGELLESYTVPR